MPALQQEHDMCSNRHRWLLAPLAAAIAAMSCAAVAQDGVAA
jgi:hypothetical protein